MQAGFFHTPYNLPTRTARQMFDWSLKLAQVCDEAGFADFMIGEHSTLAWENIPCPEIIIGAAAPLTKNIRFAPMAHLLPYHNPASLAIQVGWLSQILEGRYFLGVAPGGHHTDAILHGFEGIGPLQEQMFEALELMEKVWARKPFMEKGKFFQAGFPGPDTMPEYDVEIADNSPWGGREALEIAVTGLTKNSSSLKWAGERNYSPISFFGGHEVMRSHYDTWAAAMQSKGFTPDTSRFRVTREIFIADTDAEARKRAKASGMAKTWEHYLFPIYKKFNLFPGIIADAGLDIDPSQIDMDFLADHVWLCGSPETVKGKIENMIERSGGCGQIIVNSHDNIDNPEPYFESLQRLAQEVLPNVKTS
ncbi:LLM class flavin-dependent oxidoreductase [Pseudomonas monteilii]|uniref:2,5-diketocamphane 1,2-monooxygenase 2 n=2 Tax=Pseudomonas TaxID=286 RepID=25DK2_PSEPU|nr:LLM class flavin-dependent oxidoreductase [Pseudomonas monteilii]M5AWY0.1 RecName: Full=2,5-diketocamphane 1,2-monooxygenase 2; Short=2,5-DKCMO 2; Short=2,5-diketocamphane monooxygenase 2; AltName: Full=2,5-diketocamphane 1,2-monooxygenase oxygenating component; AltName: Full=2,5-diketocamphane 1,2-monooxygenase oxygenating subunit; AltName: Full=Camphor 1,2-monooxygenase; AltName: Full=Type II Baeyer-Villiger monooxygenase; Short=Type II BVMO [Pseudomonas putida]MDD2126954.1 LLM class flavin-